MVGPRQLTGELPCRPPKPKPPDNRPGSLFDIAFLDRKPSPTSATRIAEAPRSPSFAPVVPNKRRRTLVRTPQIHDDTLGTLIHAASARLAAASSWESFIAAERGPSHLQGHIARRTLHPAGPYLDRLATTGAPALQATPTWTPAKLNAALARGSHHSAHARSEFLRAEMATMIDQQYWTVLPYSQVKHLPHLRLSPLGVVPQRDRRDRIIVDLSFSGVNADTVPLAPMEAMQFGRALDRTLYKIRHANRRFGPVFMIKVDLADGFYRLWVTAATVPTLGVVFPHLPGEEPLVAFPLVLPMGWVSSPPYFCALSETVADIANQRLWDRHWIPPTHKLSVTADTPNNLQVLPRRTAAPAKPVLLPADAPAQPPLQPPPPFLPGSGTGSAAAMPPLSCSSKTPRYKPSPLQTQGSAASPHSLQLPRIVPSGSAAMPHSLPRPLPVPTARASLQPLPSPVEYVDLYMDDFLGLAQGHPRRRERVRNTIFSSIDVVFRPNEPSDSAHRKETISLSKLNKGDACWATRKILLGWLIDSIAETIALPEHRHQRFLEILHNLQNRRRVSLKVWHKTLGELRSMILAIPGGRGLFSTLQTGLQHTEKHRVRLSQPIVDALEDFHHLAVDLGARPTRLGEIVPDIPVALGPADACGLGMGGVWLSADPAFHPVLWRAEFPLNIQTALVSTDNPLGTITNSDLELAAQIAHQDILVQQHDCRERTIGTLTNNIPTRSWQRKGSTTTLGPAAYLLRLNALHQRHYRYLSLPDYIPGPVNAMADDTSRLWALTDNALLAHFNLSYPQHKPWQMLHLRPEMLSALVMALQCKRSEPALFLHAHDPKTLRGFDGVTIAMNWQLTPCSSMWTTPSPSSKSLPNAGAQAKLLPAKNLSSLAQWRRPSGLLGRRWPAWGPMTFDSHPKARYSTVSNNS